MTHASHHGDLRLVESCLAHFERESDSESDSDSSVSSAQSTPSHTPLKPKLPVAEWHTHQLPLLRWLEPEGAELLASSLNWRQMEAASLVKVLSEIPGSAIALPAAALEVLRLHCERLEQRHGLEDSLSQQLKVARVMASVLKYHVQSPGSLTGKTAQFLADLVHKAVDQGQGVSAIVLVLDLANSCPALVLPLESPSFRLLVQPFR